MDTQKLEKWEIIIPKNKDEKTNENEKEALENPTKINFDVCEMAAVKQQIHVVGDGKFWCIFDASQNAWIFRKKDVLPEDFDCDFHFLNLENNTFWISEDEIIYMATASYGNEENKLFFEKIEAAGDVHLDSEDDSAFGN